MFELVLASGETVRDLLDRGGDVLVVIAFAIAVMWTLIAERILYLRYVYPGCALRAFSSWQKRTNQQSWHSEQIKTAIVSQLLMDLRSGMPMIRSIAAVCPLLGLLGTVTGMILIFNVIMVTGMGNPRSVAAGVSTATITTMAGMVAALSGIFPSVLLGRRVNALADRLNAGDQSPQATDVGQSFIRWWPVRWGASAAIGVSVAYLLLFLMQQMILIGREALTDAPPFRVVDFIRLEQPDVVNRKSRKPKPLPKPEQQPTQEIPPWNESTKSTLAIAAPSMPRAGFEGRIRVFTGITASDGDYLPLVKVAPIYPRFALLRQLEGYVIVRFTVTENGSVEDVEVVESSNSMFERAAVDAAYKFKYKPRTVNGRAVQVSGVYNRITFVLDKPRPEGRP